MVHIKKTFSEMQLKFPVPGLLFLGQWQRLLNHWEEEENFDMTALWRSGTSWQKLQVREKHSLLPGWKT